jgi:hypothetical protein
MSDAKSDDAYVKRLERAIAVTSGEMDSPRSVFAAVTGVCFSVVVVQKALEYSGRVHVALGAILCLVIAVAFIWLARIASRPPLAYTRSMCAIHLSLGLMLAIVMAGWVSYTLDALKFGTYNVASARSMNTFIGLYFFTLADLIPLLDITKTLHLKSPAEPQNFIAGLPVLAFRVFVLWFLFEEFRTWRKGRKKAGMEKSTDLPLFGVFFLIFVVIVLPGLR